MATLVLGLAGAALGNAFLGAGVVGLGLTGTQIGFFIGSSLGGLFGGGGETIKQEGQRLSDLKVQTSTYGNMIPIYYGIDRGTGNVIWSTDLKEKATTTESGGGGKGGGGGGGSVETTTYTYSVSFAVQLADSYGRKPLGVLRVWANNLLILDLRPEAQQVKNFEGSYRVYLGGEDQEPSSLQESFLGVGNVPAYRGQMVIEFQDMQLAKFGNRIPNISCEIVFDADNVLERPTNFEHASSANAIKIANGGGIIQSRPIAFREIDNDNMSIGYYDLESDQYVPVNTFRYDQISFGSPGDPVYIDLDRFLFTFDFNGVFVRDFEYWNPLTFNYERKSVHEVWMSQPNNQFHRFSAETYLPIQTYTSTMLGVPGLFVNTIGYTLYDDVLCRGFLVKQNPVLVGCFMVFFKPGIAFITLSGNIEAQVEFSHTFINDVLNDDVYAQPYLNQDLLVGYRATNFGSDTNPITVATISQSGVYTVLFTSSFSGKQNSEVTCFYDEIRNRLVFICVEDATNRTKVVYYNISRTRIDIKNEMSNLENTFENVYSYSTTPVEVYITDEDGNYLLNVSPEANFGGLTKDGSRIFFSDGSGLSKGETYLLDAEDYTILSISLDATDGIPNRGNVFYPNYTEPAWFYKNQAITVNQDNGITRTPYTPDVGDGVTLASIVQNISDKVGMGDKVDVSELQSDLVYGYKISQVMTARNAIETLQRAYQFDSVESTE